MIEPRLALEESTPARAQRARVFAVLEKRRLQTNVSPEEASASWEQDRFVARARALFYARMMFLTLGLLILAIPAWSRYFFLGGPLSFLGYFVMLLYSVANLLVIEHRRASRWVTYVTLCLDLLISVVLINKPEVGGGLQSPLLATQLLFTTLFAILFPKPLAILPPLLALPITTRLDLLLDRSVTAVELLTVLWYSALNFIIVYVIVYLNEREQAAHREVVELQGDLKDLAVVEERNRLAREIHDGLGASLSSLIIQSEYLLQLAKDEPLRSEIRELKTSAEESDRRAAPLAADDARGLRARHRRRGLPPHTSASAPSSTSASRRAACAPKLSPDAQLTIFRVLQECLSNAAKHAAPTKVEVKLAFEPREVLLSVRDDGKGFDPGAGKHGHYGLRNMRERAIKVGGQLIVDSKPGQGAHLTFSIPLTGN